MIRASSLYRGIVYPVLASAAVAFLSACSYTIEQQAVEPEDWQQRILNNSMINAWTIQARLGIQSETEGGRFDLFWDETPATYTIRMIAPMGRGAAQIKGNEDGVTLKMADGREQFSDDPDELFATMTGLALPVAPGLVRFSTATKIPPGFTTRRTSDSPPSKAHQEGPMKSPVESDQEFQRC